MLSILLLLPSVPFASSHDSGFPSTYDSTVLSIDTIYEPESLDPAWIYDTVSGEVIMNVYETLIFPDRSYTGVGGYYQTGKTDVFVPRLATSWSSHVIDEMSPEGLHWVKRFTFAVRTGLPFHNGALLTTEDVEYSFERWLAQDRDGGAQWMLYYWLTADYSASDPVEDPAFGLKIDHAVENNDTHVWFNLVLPALDKTFLQILNQPWSSIVNKAWCQAKGDLKVESVSGGWSNWAQIYGIWHNPWISFIEGDMMGTGPYKFSYWNYGDSYSIVRNPSYWDGWPARTAEGSFERLPSYISTVVWSMQTTNWTNRRQRFLDGTVDITIVDRPYRDQVLGQPGVRCWYGNSPPEWLPTLSVTGAFFNFNITHSSYHAPVMYPPDTFGPDGIPPNIFGISQVINPGADEGLNVRKGFAYAFDYEGWLVAAYLGEGTHPSDPIIPGTAYDNLAQSKPAFNMTKAAYYLKLAWGGVDSRSGVPSVPVFPEDPAVVTPGALWANGMKFVFYTNWGATPLQLAYEVWVKNINSLNPLFKLQGPYGAPWGPYLLDITKRLVPIFLMGWIADYPDPDNMIFPFMHNQGIFALWQSYKNPRVDALIEEGIITPDDTAPYSGELDAPDPRQLFNNQTGIPPDTRWPRRSIYYELQAIYAIDDIPSITLVTAIGRHWERDWVRGWYYNPSYSGEYVYHLWKAKTHLGDANNDGNVDIVDIGVLSAHWSGPPTGSLGYNPMADLTGGCGGTSGGLSGQVVGIPDGRVDVVDVALINAYWDGPPIGPSHP